MTAADDCLAGGGELGARMRAIDWSTTPLGPVASWPQSLRTCVRIILTSRQPMFVWWGDDLVNLYNDAYKSIVGGKHPEALGQPAAVVWREIWDQAGPRANTAMRTNEGTYDEGLLLIMERNGYPEETYYTFSYSPVPNDQGGAGGIICANSDDTQRIISERQLTLLRDLGTATATARSFDDTCRAAAASLSQNPKDLPFAMLYLYDAAQHTVKLAAATGIEPGHAAAPATLALDGPAPWPIAEVLRSHETRVVEAAALPADLPSGAWPRSPDRAIVMPLGTGGSSLLGVLVAGLNPFRLLDVGYRGFLDLAVGQIAASLSTAQAYEEERRRAQALAEIDRAKTAFFSNVSHEFRTPLTLMLGPTEDALASPAQALSGESLRSVHRNELRLLKLVNTLLDFSRIEAGRVQASYEPTDLGALTRELASAFESAITRGGLQFEVDSPSLGELFVDRDMWEKIVLNLVSNAFKFTFAGRIRVALQALGERVELSVADSGVGIAAAELPRIFERFHRIEGTRSRTHEGSGIGLALVHDLVKLHGGELRVESEPGRGTTFFVSLPRGKAHLPAERVQASSHAAPTPVRAESFVAEALRWLPAGDEDDGDIGLGAAALTQVSPARIVVADDNADMRSYVTRLLRAQGWVVEAVKDGVAALEAIRRQRPDIVLSDVMMPNLDGFGLLRAMRGDPELGAVPLILLSARAGEESRVEGLDEGANDYLVKPFSARELVARVQAQLASHELRRAEERNRGRLSRLFTHAPVAIAMLRGPNHVFDLANDAYLDIVGNRDIVERPIRQALPELEGQGLYELLDRVYRTGEPFFGNEYALQLDRGHGTLEPAFFNFVYQPMTDEHDEIEGVLIVAHDITEQVRARRSTQELLEREQAARRDAERARDEAARLATLVEESSDFIGFASLDGELRYVNPAGWQLVGLQSLEEARTMRLPDLVPDEDRATAQAALERVLEVDKLDFELRFRHRDTGAIIPVQWTLFALRSDAGTPYAFGLVIRDLTAAQLARRDAESANRAKDEFLAMLGHELRNPLAPISTALHLMRLRGAGMERERAVIQRQVDHLVRLVDDLLDVSRITRGKIELKREKLELAEIAARAIELASPLYEQRQHGLTVAVPRTGLVVDGDPTRLGQVIANLLTNAAKYTEPGGKISLTAERQGDEVVVRVRDTGVGITDDMLPRVFDLFSQERQTIDRSQGGLGLGLAIVKSLVQLHGGSVAATSDGPGRGSEFLVRLPAAELTAEAAPPAPRTTPPRGLQASAPDAVSASPSGATGAHARRILIVDDNTDAAELLAESLRELGCVTQVAHDGPSGLKLAEDFRPDVALLDIGLPVMDGYELARRIRELPALATVKLVAITGYGQEADRRRAVAAGFDRHLVKPISLEAVEKAIAVSAPPS